MLLFIFIILFSVIVIASGIVCLFLYILRLSDIVTKKNIKKASRLISSNNYQEAQKLLTRIISNKKGSKAGLLLHVHLLRKKRCLKEALTILSYAKRRWPEELQFRLEEGLILLELGQPKEALEAFEVCSPIIKKEADILALSSALYLTGKTKQAYDLVEPLVEHTQNGELLALVGNIFFGQKQFHKSINFYTNAINLGYKTHFLSTQLAHSFRQLGNLAKAEQIFRSLLKKDGDDLDAILGLGACMQERGDFQRALLIYQTSTVWNKKDHRLMREAAICALKTKKYFFAELYLLEVINKMEKNIDPTILARYGFALEKQNKWQEAEQLYLRLIQEYPSYPQGFRALAWMFGVGLTRTISNEDGKNFAYIAANLSNDTISWEIVSACEARLGNFQKAYQIQLLLVNKDKTKPERIRRQQALRSLRKQHPLDEQQVIRSLVA